MKIKIVAPLVIVAIALIGVYTINRQKLAPHDQNIIVNFYQNGQMTNLKPDTAAFSASITAAEQGLANEELIQLNVATDELANIKKTDPTIEIIYPQFKNFSVGNKKNITINKILIPLSNFATEMSMIIYYDKDNNIGFETASEKYKQQIKSVLNLK